MKTKAAWKIVPLLLTSFACGGSAHLPASRTPAEQRNKARAEPTASSPPAADQDPQLASDVHESLQPSPRAQYGICRARQWVVQTETTRLVAECTAAHAAECPQASSDGDVLKCAVAAYLYLEPLGGLLGHVLNSLGLASSCEAILDELLGNGKVCPCSAAAARQAALAHHNLTQPVLCGGVLGIKWNLQTRTIVEIVPSGPAERAGLRVDDRIYAYGGVETPTGNALAQEIENHAPGETVDVVIYRTGSGVMTANVTLGPR